MSIVDMATFAKAENSATKRHWNHGNEIRAAFADMQLPAEVDEICREIASEVEAFTGVSAGVILRSRKRTAIVTRARQFCFWRAYQKGLTSTQIGRAFNRDQTTIMHGIKQIEKRVQKEGKA